MTGVFRSRARRIVAATAALVTTAMVVATGPASGLDRTVPDGPDDPPGVDITSVVYRNHERTAGAVVQLRKLGDSGRMVTRIGPPDSDVWYAATVRMKGDGTMVTRLRIVSDMGTSKVDCDFNAAWINADDTVSVTVPHTCLTFGRFMTREWFQSSMYKGAHSDDAKGVDVGRGDSPGCATVGEMGKVKDGQTRFRVHQNLDTAGKYGDSGAGSYARTYRACDGGDRWFVQYSRQDNTVVNKGRV